MFFNPAAPLKGWLFLEKFWLQSTQLRPTVRLQGAEDNLRQYFGVKTGGESVSIGKIRFCCVLVTTEAEVLFGRVYTQAKYFSS